MLTREKSCGAQGTKTKPGSKRAGLIRPSGPRSAAKRRKAPSQAGQTLNGPDGVLPVALQRQPLVADKTAQGKASPPQPSASVMELTVQAISKAVLKGLTDAGVIAPTSGNSGQNSDPAASVQESVAAVVQDLTGEGNNVSSNHTISVPDTLETPNRPANVHKLISVPLAGRVPEKIQTKIWANEYVELALIYFLFKFYLIYFK